MTGERPRRRWSRGELAFTGLLWLVAGFVFSGAFAFRYPANVAPLLLGGSAFFLLSWLLLSELYRGWRAGRSTAEPAMPTAATVAPTDVDVQPAAIAPGAALDAERHELAALLWTMATIGLLLALGFLAGVTIALVGLFRLHGRESWPATIIATAVVMASLYIAFGIFLRVPFFPGLMVDLLP